MFQLIFFVIQAEVQLCRIVFDRVGSERWPQMSFALSRQRF